MPVRNPLALLSDPDAYLAQIDRLRKKYTRVRRLDSIGYRELTLADLGTQDQQLARRLARAVGRGAFRFGRVVPYRARLKGKERVLFRSNLIDTVVLSVLAQVVSELSEPVLSSCVYSYRTGRSQWEVHVDLRRFLAEHRAARPCRRDRGLYVLHRDIKSYAPSVPTGDESRLWLEFRRVLAHHGVPDDHHLWDLLRGALRPDLDVPDGEAPPIVGVPFGSAALPFACNLYVSSLDRLIDAIPGAFYSRYCDDILFCHPDARVARRVATEIDDTIHGLGLEFGEKKKWNFYLTTPGRPSVDWPEAKPTSQFDYLGYRVDLAGNIGMKTEKVRRLLSELRIRARSACEAARGTDTSPTDSTVRAVCQAVARAIDPDSEVCDPAAPALRYIVTNRRQLGEIDYAIALMVAETLTGIRGPRAFRQAPQRRLRQLGLPSLVYARNAQGRQERAAQ